MPKMKSHRGAMKRLKKTGTGKIMHRGANLSHLLSGKTAKRKRRLGRSFVVSKGDAKRIASLIYNK
ncbi:MAG: 50S ribosomal protein L35 [Bacillota bacterium]